MTNPGWKRAKSFMCGQISCCKRKSYTSILQLLLPLNRNLFCFSVEEVRNYFVSFIQVSYSAKVKSTPKCLYMVSTDCEEPHFSLVISLRRDSHQIPQFCFTLNWENQQWHRHRDSYSIPTPLSCVVLVLCSSFSIHSCSETKINRPNWNCLEQFGCAIPREFTKAIQKQ